MWQVRWLIITAEVGENKKVINFPIFPIPPLPFLSSSLKMLIFFWEKKKSKNTLAFVFQGLSSFVFGFVYVLSVHVYVNWVGGMKIESLFGS